MSLGDRAPGDDEQVTCSVSSGTNMSGTGIGERVRGDCNAVWEQSARHHALLDVTIGGLQVYTSCWKCSLQNIEMQGDDWDQTWQVTGRRANGIGRFHEGKVDCGYGPCNLRVTLRQLKLGDCGSGGSYFYGIIMYGLRRKHAQANGNDSDF